MFPIDIKEWTVSNRNNVDNMSPYRAASPSAEVGEILGPGVECIAALLRRSVKQRKNDGTSVEPAGSAGSWWFCL